MTFYIYRKDKNDPLRNIPIAEFKIHSFDIYWKTLSDSYEFKETMKVDDKRFEEGYMETLLLNKETGEVVMIMKNTLITWLDYQDYELLLEDA